MCEENWNKIIPFGRIIIIINNIECRCFHIDVELERFGLTGQELFNLQFIHHIDGCLFYIYILIDAMKLFFFLSTLRRCEFIRTEHENPIIYNFYEKNYMKILDHISTNSFESRHRFHGQKIKMA